MAGPWEKYGGAPAQAAPAQDGPWARYGAQQQPQAAPQPRRRQEAPALTGDPRAQILGAAGEGVRMTSGYRDPQHNARVGGVANSYHTRGTGQAMDLVPAPGETMAQLRARLAASGLPLAENIDEGDHVHVGWNGPGLGDNAGGQSLGYGIADRQDLTEAERNDPSLLAAQGYALDAATNTYARTVGAVQASGQQAPAQPQRSQGYQTALGQEQELSRKLGKGGVETGFTDQFTAPLNDEIAGAAGYLTQGASNLGRRLMGRDIEISASDRARAATDVARQQQEAFAKEHPVQTGVGGIMGGFAFAPSRAAGALTGAQNFLKTSQAFRLPTAAQGYAAAGITGAGYGAADAEGGPVGRAIGAGTGAAGGLATAGLLDGAGGIIGRLSSRGPRMSSQQNRVADVIQRELRTNRVDPNDFLSSLNGAPGGSLPFNVRDGALSGAAEVLASSPGPGGRIVRQAVDSQRAGSGDRIMSRIGNEVGGEGNYFATLNTQVQQRRDAANQVIDQIGPQTFRMNDNTVRSLRSDLAQGEIRKAATNALASPDQQTYEMGANLMRLADTLRDNPSAAVLDVRTAQDVSRGLLDLANDAWKRSDGTTGKAIGDIGRAVRNNAREAVPEYGNWLQRYGDESSQIEALELGRRVFRNADDPSADGMSAEVLRGQFADMSDTAKDMFRKGIGEALVARARTSRGGVGAMRDLIRTEEFADRVKIAFPDEQSFTRFLNAAEAEVGMANAGNTITGNSRTAPRLAAARRLGAQDAQQGADTLSQATLTGIPLAVGRAGIRATGRAMGKQRSVLENDDLNELFGRALTDEQLLRQMLSRPGRRGLFGGRAPGIAGAVPQVIPGF